MHMFIEKGMHDISMVSKRCKSKLALLYTDDYDPEKYNNYTMYYDAKKPLWMGNETSITIFRF